MTWPCFMVTETDQSTIILRRFTWSSDGECPGSRWGHDASVTIGRAPTRYADDREDDRRYLAAIDIEPWLIDHRWPTTCTRCDRPFTDSEMRQVNQDPIYRADDGREWAQKDLPIGALYDIHWGQPHWKGADGRCLQVKLPPGGPHDLWTIDGPASDGQFWARTGQPPNITVTPSIATGNYHGFLQHGHLTDPL